MSPDSNEEKRAQVIKFLKEFQALARHGRPSIVPRSKNYYVLSQLGLTLTDQWNILLHLKVENFVTGPEPDRDRPGEVWIFGWIEKSVELYIKIKIAEYTPVDAINPVRKPLCISFHPAEEKLIYPLK